MKLSQLTGVWLYVLPIIINIVFIKIIAVSNPMGKECSRVWTVDTLGLTCTTQGGIGRLSMGFL